MKYMLKAGAAALLLGLALPMSATAQNMVDSDIQEVLDHIKAHGVSVIRTSDGGAMLVLETQFGSGRLPELRVGLGRDGMFMPGTDLGTLRKITGMQVFRAPPSLDIDEFDTLVIYDPSAAVPVGLAPLG